jgi:hypothetical protein
MNLIGYLQEKPIPNHYQWEEKREEIFTLLIFFPKCEKWLGGIFKKQRVVDKAC